MTFFRRRGEREVASKDGALWTLSCGHVVSEPRGAPRGQRSVICKLCRAAKAPSAAAAKRYEGVVDSFTSESKDSKRVKAHE